jgi:hypothetical protein
MMDARLRPLCAADSPGLVAVGPDPPSPASRCAAAWPPPCWACCASTPAWPPPAPCVIGHSPLPPVDAHAYATAPKCDRDACPLFGLQHQAVELRAVAPLCVAQCDIRALVAPAAQRRSSSTSTQPHRPGPSCAVLGTVAPGSRHLPTSLACCAAAWPPPPPSGPPADARFTAPLCDRDACLSRGLQLQAVELRCVAPLRVALRDVSAFVAPAAQCLSPPTRTQPQSLCGVDAELGAALGRPPGGGCRYRSCTRPPDPPPLWELVGGSPGPPWPRGHRGSTQRSASCGSA